MALMDESVWRGKIYSGGGIGASGARFGGVANLDALTDTRWVTVRGDIAPYPF
jgi:benzaldehyde dehydrogenase (NAD)